MTLQWNESERLSFHHMRVMALMRGCNLIKLSCPLEREGRNVASMRGEREQESKKGRTTSLTPNSPRKVLVDKAKMMALEVV